MATAAFVLLTVFEVLVLTDAIEVKASTVAKIAPWAYEPFLRFVGELPGTPPHATPSRGTAKKESTAMELMTGLSPKALTLDVETNVVPETNEVPAQPTETSTNAPAKKSQEVVPVG